jgi:signal transduction histidine kinase
MRRRFPSRRFRASVERTVVLLIGAAIAVPLLVIVALPAAITGTARAVIALGTIAVSTFAAMMLARRHLARLAARLARAERDARQAERLAAVGRVAAGIAHEIGNPLSGISNYTHILRSRVPESSDADAAFTGIARELERIDAIVGGLLDYARPREGNDATFDAARALRGALELLSAQGVLRRVDVRSAIDSEPMSMNGRPHELEQAFLNLLLNAIEAMESKGTLALYAGRSTTEAVAHAPRRSADEARSSFERRVNERLETWRQQRPQDTPCAKFVIADSGSGVDDAQAEQIFDPFFTTKDPDDGTGLGLAIVQRVIEDHEGVVWVQPAREGGAAFHVVLPLEAFGRKAPKDVS